MKRKSILILALLFFVLCAGFGAAVYLHKGTAQFAQSALSKSKGLVTRFTGLKPGTPVSYAVMKDNKGTLIAGEILAEINGIVDLPVYDMQPDEKDPFSYAIIIEEEEGPITINFKIDPRDGTVEMSGGGLDGFSDIVVDASKERVKTKTDWGGLFKNLEMSGLMKTENFEDQEGFEVAFYGNNAAGDIEKTNPLIMNVETGDGSDGGDGGDSEEECPTTHEGPITADCGGGPDEEHVNEYKTQWCGSDPELSICDEDAVDRTIEKMVDNYVTAFMMMSEQFAAVMAYQVQIFGTFLDAKYQMETQRYFQRLNAQAHKDYHPSNQMCRIGSYVKSVARTEAKTAYNHRALSKILQVRMLNTEHGSTAEGYAGDVISRLEQFRKVYCDPLDNNDGLYYMCDHDQDGDPNTDGTGATDRMRMNKDVDFTRTAYFPMTLDIDFLDQDMSADEEDVIALGRNLYWPEALESALPEKLPQIFPEYLNLRNLVAVNNIAQNSFAHYIADKGKSDPEIETSGWRFMKAAMVQFGLEEEEIDDLVGEYPSYNAQMEILTKKIFQDPDFYTHLYDKPANVDRINVSLEAIKIMQQRDFYKTNLRRELLNSLLVEQELEPHFEKINQQMNTWTAQNKTGSN